MKEGLVCFRLIDVYEMYRFVLSRFEFRLNISVNDGK